MAHMPINHPFRPLYRTIAGVCGIAVIGFGLLGSVNTAGAVLFVVLGAMILAGALIGTNVGRWLHLVAGVSLLVVGLASLALLRSDANLFAFSVATCVGAFVVGLAVLTSGLYEQVGAAEKREREEQFRHGQAPDPEEHLLGAHHVPRGVSGPGGGSG